MDAVVGGEILRKEHPDNSTASACIVSRIVYTRSCETDARGMLVSVPDIYGAVHVVGIPC
jgi:hypothetical protein